MGQENQEINIGEIFIDNINFDLYGKYHVVEVVDLSYKEMWGLKGKEIVTIVKYKKLANKRHSETTLDIFKDNFKSIADIRDEKLNKLLDDLL